MTSHGPTPAMTYTLPWPPWMTPNMCYSKVAWRSNLHTCTDKISNINHVSSCTPKANPDPCPFLHSKITLETWHDIQPDPHSYRASPPLTEEVPLAPRSTITHTRMQKNKAMLGLRSICLCPPRMHRLLIHHWPHCHLPQTVKTILMQTVLPIQERDASLFLHPWHM